MQLIVISNEEIIPDEAGILSELFEAGMPLLHLRKPNSDISLLRKLLTGIPHKYHKQIVLHDCFSLFDEFELKGVHLNRRESIAPTNIGISISKSCHSLVEVENEAAKYDYIFLSPIFDSISKSGYLRAFSDSELQKAHVQGIINEKVVALGGISLDKIPVAASYGFGGVAVLGALWNGPRGEITKRLTSLMKAAKIDI